MRKKDLQSALRDEEPRIVHFSGHGMGNQGLVVEDEQGKSCYSDSI